MDYKYTDEELKELFNRTLHTCELGFSARVVKTLVTDLMATRQLIERFKEKINDQSEELRKLGEQYYQLENKLYEAQNRDFSFPQDIDI